MFVLCVNIKRVVVVPDILFEAHAFDLALEYNVFEGMCKLVKVEVLSVMKNLVLFLHGLYVIDHEVLFENGAIYVFGHNIVIDIEGVVEH